MKDCAGGLCPNARAVCANVVDYKRTHFTTAASDLSWGSGLPTTLFIYAVMALLGVMVGSSITRTRHMLRVSTSGPAKTRG